MAGAAEVASSIDCLIVWSQGTDVRMYGLGRVVFLRQGTITLFAWVMHLIVVRKRAMDAAVTPTLKLQQASCGCRRVAMVGRRTC